jgi:hypothetical protein
MSCGWAVGTAVALCSLPGAASGAENCNDLPIGEVDERTRMVKTACAT